MKKNYISRLVILIAALAGSNFGAIAQTTTFSTPGQYTLTVPQCTQKLTVDMTGGKGGNGTSSGSPVAAGGNGGRVVCVLNVTPGQVLNIIVGGAGLNGATNTSVAGGYNNTVGVGGYSNANCCYSGGSGGGASEICIGGTALANRVIVAGAGGGGGCNFSTNFGGNGGGLTGQGLATVGGEYCGTGGTQVGGGLGGSWLTYGTSSNGGQRVGGTASTYPTYIPGSAGGGGGGGYYGGGGGVWGGGGGGSSYADASRITGAATHTQGYNFSGNGYVSLTPVCTAPTGGVIVGNVPLCGAGVTLPLTSTGSSCGVWSSSTTAVATIDPSTGVLLTTGAGTTVINYNITLPCGVASSTPITVTVNPTPLPISGPTNICTGQTYDYTSATFGGTWSSSVPSLATVISSGVVGGITTATVLGVATGLTTISYTSAGCATTQVVSVNLSPAAISGTPSVCRLSTTALFDGTPGGTWTSSFLPLAIVGSITGIVTGLLQGAVTISYTVGNCSATIPFNVLGIPQAYIMNASPSNNLCIGSSAHIGITASNTGISYQIYRDGTPIGAPFAGTGAAIDFGLFGTAGNYSVIATDTTSHCTTPMFNTVTLNVFPLPALQIVTTPSGPSFCAGGSTTICLPNSETGVRYQLYNGLIPGPIIPGTGAPICFPAITSPGSYTVVATNISTGCSSTMIGTANITLIPPPNLYNVTGGGNYCTGGTGVPVGVDFSQTGVNYQLYINGGPGPIIPGTGGPITFGPQTTTGSYVVIATNTTTGCSSTMTGSANVNIVSPPFVYNITSTGTHYCALGPGIEIGTDGSDNLFNYLLYNGTTLVDSVSGIGSGITFGLQTAAGTYTIVSHDALYGCASNMTGSVTITIDPLPTLFNVTGGGSYCLVGGSGRDIKLDGSQSGIMYTLYMGGSAIDSLPGTTGMLDFGFRSAVGVYTIVGVNMTTGCANTMSGSASITVNPPPSVFTVTGGGQYCSGGIGVPVGLDFSSIGVNYQLYINAVATGTPVAGTGAAISFGLQTAMGTYSVRATNVATTCTADMINTVSVVINPLPAAYTVTGGGQYCTGTSSTVHVGLSLSDPWIRYQLYLGTTPVGGPVAGTGLPLDFGVLSAAGVYTVIAMDTTTLCTRTMTGLVVVVINPLPTAFTVIGGGIYCVGGTGVHIGLSGSNAAAHYNLIKDGITLVTTVPGTGAAIDFGSQTATGSYTVVGVNNATSCTNNMGGSAIVMISPLPTAYTVTGGGNYCPGGDGFNVGLSSSNSGINYQLYRGGVAIGGIVSGTGGALDFGMQTIPGVYTVVATDALAGCVKTMNGSAIITLYTLPSAYSVLGGGNYCDGGAGKHVYLSTSSTGVSYQLFMDGTMTGDPITGTGSGLDFGIFTAPGTYTVVATTTSTGCTNNMSGNAVIDINPLPVAHSVTVTDGGNYCITGTGVHVGLDGSQTGVHYQLYKGGATLGGYMLGTGSALDFGIHNAGTYTIVATNATTGCVSNMEGSAVVTAVPLPTVYSVTGGGTYCETGLGLHVGLSGSDMHVSYQLIHGTTALGMPLSGTGDPLDFGLETASGTYTVMASNGLTGCNRTMGGSAVVTIHPVILPIVHVSTGVGDTVCTGQLTTFTASPINGGGSPSYQWYVNGIPFGTGGSTYSYVPLDGDMVTVMLTSNATCAIPDTGSRTIKLTVSPPQMPAIHVTADPGDIICQGSPVTFNATTSYGGSHPGITWLKNSSVVMTSGLSYTYTPVDNDVIVVMMGSDFPCSIVDTVFSNTNTIQVEPKVIPTVSITANPSTHVATGQSVTFAAIVAHGGQKPRYQWLVNSLIVAGATNATYTANNLSNSDSVTCQVVGGCELTGFNSVIMHIASVGVQQVTAAGSDDIRLIPNPNKGTFTIKGTLNATVNEEVSVEVTNMLGQVVYSGKVMTDKGIIDQRIQLNSSLANGMYILNLRSGSQDNIFHFVIEQ